MSEALFISEHFKQYPNKNNIHVVLILKLVTKCAIRFGAVCFFFIQIYFEVSKFDLLLSVADSFEYIFNFIYYTLIQLDIHFGPWYFNIISHIGLRS